MYGRYTSVKDWLQPVDGHDANDVDSHGFTLLYRVLQFCSDFAGMPPIADRSAMARYLVAKGADITATGMTTNNVGPTMLYAHCTSWDLEMVTMLLELGSSVSRASVEHAFCDNDGVHSTYSGRNERIVRQFDPAVLREMVRAGASLDFVVPPGNVPPERFLRELLDHYAPAESRASAINAGITLVSGVREAGSFKSY